MENEPLYDLNLNFAGASKTEKQEKEQNDEIKIKSFKRTQRQNFHEKRIQTAMNHARAKIGPIAKRSQSALRAQRPKTPY